MPNEYRIGRSARYAVLTSVLHAGAVPLVALPIARLAPELALLAGMLLAVALWRDLVTVAWRGTTDAVVAVEIAEGRWRLRRHGGAVFGPAVLEGFRGAAAGVLLLLRDEQGVRERVTLPADALSHADLRRIRVHAHAALAGAAA